MLVAEHRCGMGKRLGLGFSLLFFILAASPLCLAASRNLAHLKEYKNFSTHSYYKSSSCQTVPPAAGITPSQGAGSHNSPTTPRHHDDGRAHNGRGSCTCDTAPPTTPYPPHVPLPPHLPHPPHVPLPPSSTTPSPQLPVNPPIVTIPSPPYIPFNPPSITTPSPPFIPDPNSSPFTCYYWFTHPTSIWILFGYWGSIGQVFSMPPSAISPYGRSLTLLQALGNTRRDGYGLLLREGTASLLNSMATRTFYFNTEQVKIGFNDAIRSEKMAGEQGRIFQKANEGHLKH